MSSSPKKDDAKALQCACRGSFTVEAALVVPFFLFAAAIVIGLFPLLLVQVQVNNGLQYAARLLAVSYTDAEDEENGWGLLVGEALFETYLTEHGCYEAVLSGGVAGISFGNSDVSGDTVLLTAEYDVSLPISFWGFQSLPVVQSVQMKKWTGADSSGDTSDGSYVYITPSGSAYHLSAECSYLKLSIKSVSVSTLDTLRNKSGGIYYPCSCYSGGSVAYITDYGTQYHSDLDCSGLKRTIYKVSIENVGDRHACAKCY